MATPAVPPANMTAGKLSGGAAAFSPFGRMGGAGDKERLSSSYVAKYLRDQLAPNVRAKSTVDPSVAPTRFKGPCATLQTHPATIAVR